MIDIPGIQTVFIADHGKVISARVLSITVTPESDKYTVALHVDGFGGEPFRTTVLRTSPAKMETLDAFTSATGRMAFLHSRHAEDAIATTSMLADTTLELRHLAEWIPELLPVPRLEKVIQAVELLREVKG